MEIEHSETLGLGKEYVGQVLKNTFFKLNPRQMVRNPVMMVVEIGTVVTLWFTFQAGNSATRNYDLLVTGILFITLLFATFAEAYAEARGRAQADSLRKMKSNTRAKVITSGRLYEWKDSSLLAKGDRVLVEAGDTIPGDGVVLEGVGSVDESAITGESAPVIKAHGDSVTGGTLLQSDEFVVEITVNPGESFLDRMIQLVEGAKRLKTPNEIALSALLGVLTLIFVLVVVTLYPTARYYGPHATNVTTLVALLVCLIPTTIGALLSAIGIAGMSRVAKVSVIAKSGRAVEAAGDIDTIILDKTGTITVGNRMATEFLPVPGVKLTDLATASLLSSLADSTPEGRSIVELAQKTLQLNNLPFADGDPVPFSAHTRMSGIDLADGRQIRKGAVDAILKLVRNHQGELQKFAEDVARQGATPLAVSVDHRALGVIGLHDVVKSGLKKRFKEFRLIGHSDGHGDWR